MHFVTEMCGRAHLCYKMVHCGIWDCCFVRFVHCCICHCRICDIPYPKPVVFQWQSSGNPVYLELRPQCTLECHWRNASVLPVVFQWSSSGFPVLYQCVPIMQINTGSPLEYHWVLESASVVPVASQCTCGSSGLPVCSNYANQHWIATGTPLGASISQCGSSGIPVCLWLQWSSSVVCPVVSQCTDRIWFGGH